MAVTIYASTDSGAPVLDGRPGSLLNVLNKCLVDGYGSKSGAGWTKPFADVSSTVDANAANVKFLMRMRGCAQQSSAFVEETGEVVTVVGNAMLSDKTSTSGGLSAYFDGTGDYLTVPGTAAMALGSGQFTIELWVNTTANTKTLLDYYANAVTGWRIDINASGFVQWYNGTAIKTGAVAVNDGMWHHIAFTRDASNNHTLWVDGVADGAAVANHTQNYSTTQTNISVGGQSNTRTASYDLLGYIDDVRVTVGVCRYSGPFTPAPCQDLVAPSYATTGSFLMPTGAFQFYLNINDVAGTYASACGYRTMSDNVTGTGAFPPVNGGYDQCHNYVGHHVPGSRVTSNYPAWVQDITGKR